MNNKFNKKGLVKVAVLSTFSILVSYHTAKLSFSYSFNNKYSEHSERVQNKIMEINNQNYSPEDYKNFLKVKLLNVKHTPIQDFKNKKTEEIFSNFNDYKFLLSENTKLLKKYEKIMSYNKVLNTDIKTIKTPVPSYKAFLDANLLIGINILKLLDSGNIDSAYLLFNEMHNNKLNHFLNANTIAYKMVIFENLKSDLILAKIIKEKYNIKVGLKKLNLKHIDIEKEIDNEIMVMLKMNQKITNNGSFDLFSYNGNFNLNYMNEVHINKYFELIDYYKDFNIVDSKNFNKFVPTFIESFIAPIESTLLQVDLPDYFSYKKDFFYYNKKVDDILNSEIFKENK